MNFDLTERQREFHRYIRRVCEGELRPRAQEVDVSREVPQENLSCLAKAGYMGLVLPEELGGAAGDMVSFVIGTEEVARCCPSTALVAATSLIRFGLPTMLYGREHYRKRLLPLLAEGRLRGSWAHTEQELGSDTKNLRTKATRTQEGFLITGQKGYVLNGPEAKGILVVAVVEEEGKTAVFLMEPPLDGLEVGERIPTVGARGAKVAPLKLSGCSVPSEALLGDQGGPTGEAVESLPHNPLVLAGYSLGIGQAALEKAIEYAKKRSTFGRPIVTYQEVHFKIADMFVGVDVARQLALRAAWLIDIGRGSYTESSVAKLFASESAQFCAHMCAQIHGGAGLVDGGEVDRIVRDSRMASILGGTSEMHRMAIADEVLAGRA